MEVKMLEFLAAYWQAFGIFAIATGIM